MRQIIYRVDAETTESGIELRFSPLRNDSQKKNVTTELTNNFTLEDMNHSGLTLQSIFPFRDDKNITYQVALFNYDK